MLKYLAALIQEGSKFTHLLCLPHREKNSSKQKQLPNVNYQ